MTNNDHHDYPGHIYHMGTDFAARLSLLSADDIRAIQIRFLEQAEKVLLPEDFAALHLLSQMCDVFIDSE